MQRRSTIATTVAVTAIMALALGGCSSTPEASGPVTLTMWHNSSDPQPLLNLYKAYEKASGNKIELVSIPADGFEDATLTRWASGDRPDVLEYHATLGNLLTLNPTENLRDLSGEKYVKKSGNLYDTAAAVDGKVYGAVIGFPQVFGLYYNREVLKAAGITPPQTFADLAKACTAIKASSPGVAPIFEAGGSIWPPQILPLEYVSADNKANAYGIAVRSNKKKLNAANSPVLAGITAYDELLKGGCFNSDVTTATFENSMAALVQGKAALVAQHSDMLPTLLDAAGGDQAKLDATIGFVGLSGTSSAVTYAPSPIGTYYLPKTDSDAKQKAALDFVRFITGKGYQGFIDESKSFPVIEGAKNPSGVSQVLLDVKKAYDRGPTAIAFNSDIPGMGGFAQLMSELVVGQKTPQQVVDSLQGQVATAAKAAGLSGW